MSFISAPAYSVMFKIFACLATAGCVAGTATVALLNSGSGGKSQDIKTTLPVSNEERKAQFLKDLGEKGCHVASSAGQEEKQFGAIYICSKDVVAPSEEIEDDREPMYYLEEESAFNELDSAKSPESLFKKIKKFQYKKEGNAGPNYIFLELSDGTSKQIPADSWEGWNLYGGFSTDTEDGEDVSETSASVDGTISS